MSRTIINFWLDTTLLCSMLLLVWTSTVIRFVFPPALAAMDWTLRRGSIDQWIGFQYALLCVLTFLILIHVMLHWNWICGVVTTRLLPARNTNRRAMNEGTRTLYGVGLLIVLLNVMGLAIAAAVLMVDGPM